eukprot:746827-Hanusia_phi.AAC.2
MEPDINEDDSLAPPAGEYLHQMFVLGASPPSGEARETRDEPKQRAESLAVLLVRWRPSEYKVMRSRVESSVKEWVRRGGKGTREEGEER